MYKYILKRLLMLIPVIVGVTFIVFFILNLSPGDPAAIILGDQATEEALEMKREELPAPAPLEITPPKPCRTGTVTVYAQDQVVYQYGGEISIRNDGQNGEEIEIVVEYPERSWPCSCFYYEEE